MGSRVFLGEILAMQSKLRTVELVLRQWAEVQVRQQQSSIRSTDKSTQHNWLELVDIFGIDPDSGDFGSALKKSHSMSSMRRLSSASSMTRGASGKKGGLVTEFPAEAQLFAAVDREFRSMVKTAQRDPVVLHACLRPGMLQMLSNLQQVKFDSSP